jgi:hypothetical protein
MFMYVGRFQNIFRFINVDKIKQYLLFAIITLNQLVYIIIYQGIARHSPNFLPFNKNSY